MRATSAATAAVERPVVGRLTVDPIVGLLLDDRVVSPRTVRLDAPTGFRTGRSGALRGRVRYHPSAL
jgi:hypothetical protein